MSSNNKQKHSGSKRTATHEPPSMPPAAKLQRRSSTLKEFLLDVPNVYNKLQQHGMTELNTFIYMHDKDLNKLCGKDGIDLTFMESLKFKSIVRKIQSQLAPKQPTNMIAVSMNEQKQLNKIKFTITQTESVQNLFSKHLNEIEQYENEMKGSIASHFAIINELLERKESLHKQISEWKSNKLTNINEQMELIAKYKNDLKLSEKKCNELLAGNNNISNRESKIVAIASEIFSSNKQFESFEEYILKHTQISNISFDEDNEFDADDYGEINENLKNPSINIPKIKLFKPVETNDSNGYKIKLKWEISNIKENSNDFVIRFLEENEIEEKTAENEWLIAKHKQIEYDYYSSKFEVEINDIFKSYKVYKFNVQLNVLEPIVLNIKSNIISFIHKINLKYHSHRGQYNDNAKYHPRSMIYSDIDGYDSELYWSKRNSDFKDDENDWVQCTMPQDALYLPTKFTVKNDGKGNGWAVKKILISIGDGNTQWFPFDCESINIENNREYQTFDINGGIDSKQIKENEFRHIKVEFITNHGCTHSQWSRFKLNEFQLHGKQL